MSPDRLTQEQRSNTMRAVKSYGSKIERSLRNALWNKGFRYRKNYNQATGKPDIVFLRMKIAVFVDGEFWHGFDWENRKLDIKSNQKFWWKKIERNIARDIVVNENLLNDGWTVIRFWGADVEKNLERCVKEIEDSIIKNRMTLRKE